MTAPRLIAITKVREECPWWPFSPDATWRLIREGKLGAVAVGRRRFVTPDLLADFVENHTRKDVA